MDEWRHKVHHLSEHLSRSKNTMNIVDSREGIKYSILTFFHFEAKSTYSLSYFWFDNIRHKRCPKFWGRKNISNILKMKKCGNNRKSHQIDKICGTGNFASKGCWRKTTLAQMSISHPQSSSTINQIPTHFYLKQLHHNSLTVAGFRKYVSEPRPSQASQVQTGQVMLSQVKSC